MDRDLILLAVGAIATLCGSIAALARASRRCEVCGTRDDVLQRMRWGSWYCPACWHWLVRQTDGKGGRK